MLGVMLTVSAGVAAADTVLIFEDAAGANTHSQDYGDNVTANVQNGFRYGGAADTPNVRADYTGILSRDVDYGDLVNIIHTTTGDNTIRFRLLADAGYTVALHSFDLAGHPHADYTIAGVEVLDGSNNVLFTQSNVLVQGDAVGPQHTTMSFAPLVAAELNIEVDVTGGPIQRRDVGLDNVRFSQALVPEPAAIALGLFIVPALAAARAARKQRSRACFALGCALPGASR
jgi:hypothetical protein